LHLLAVLVACATLGLVGMGGLVTSHGVGMAVPDWPNTYGYNMFFFPISAWVGGIFYEHLHRLVAAGVGLLTVVLAAWLHGWRARRVLRVAGAICLAGGSGVALVWPGRWQDAVVLAASGAAALGASFVWPSGAPQPRWLRRLGLLALGAVVLQGVLGGLRVTLYQDELGIVHAALAQLFFVLTGALALFTSPWWRRLGLSAADRPATGPAPRQPAGADLGPLRRLYVVVTLLVFAQLVLGATMRHQHAGLAVPDFPLAYGRVWPATDASSLAAYNRARLETRALNDITAGQIWLHMAHRLMAVAIVGAVGLAAWQTRRQPAAGPALRRLAGAWFSLVLGQFGLGAWTVWSNKAADVATLHVLAGALALLVGTLLALIASRDLWRARELRAAAPPVASGPPTAQGRLAAPCAL